MTATETKNIEGVRKYFDGCNSGDLDVYDDAEDV